MAHLILHILCALVVIEAKRVKVSQVISVKNTTRTGKTLCSAKTGENEDSWGSDRYSCTSSWETTGRCARIDHSKYFCVPNCLHENNQNDELCETSFCSWNAEKGVCSFAADHAPARRTFCDKHAGDVDRRFIDKNGKEPDFFDHNLKLGEDPKSTQRSFCRGMLADGDYQFEDEGKDPVKVILAGMMRCWRPAPGNRDSYEDPALQAEMVAQLTRDLEPIAPWPKLDLYPTLSSNPIAMTTLAKHWTVGITGIHAPHVPTSRCQEFDYSTYGPGQGVDPAGCGFFKKSFEPVQEVASCIMPKLREDPYKQLWTQVAAAAEKGHEANKTLPDMIKGLTDHKHIQYLMSVLPEEHVDFSTMIPEWNAARWPGFSVFRYLSDYQRAIEIMKQVEHDSWEGHDAAGIRRLLHWRILSTIATPFGSVTPALKESTVSAIMDECFKVPEDASYEAVSKSLLKESLRCGPIMWDKLEVSGSPLTALWIMQHNNHPETERKIQHPVCARAAISAMARQFARIKYPLNWKISRILPVSNETCLTMTAASCINFKDCFNSFMDNHMGKVAELCSSNPKCCCDDGWNPFGADKTEEDTEHCSVKIGKCGFSDTEDETRKRCPNHKLKIVDVNEGLAERPTHSE